MYKVGVTIALVAACIAATYGAQGFAPQAVNWKNASSAVAEMEAVLQTNLAQVKLVADVDNATIGVSIGLKIDATLLNVTDLVAGAQSDIGNQTLTEGTAQEFVGQMMSNVGKLMGSLVDELAALSPGAAVQIRILISGCFDSLELRAERVYTLLRRGTLICYYNLDPVETVP